VAAALLAAADSSPAVVWCAVDSIQVGPVLVGGLAYNEGFIWATYYTRVGDADWVIIYKLDAATHQIVDQSPELHWNGRGICWGGGSLWIADALYDRVRRVDPVSFHQTGSFPSGGTEPCGITFDGAHLWLVDPYAQWIRELDTSGSVMGSFHVPDEQRTGLEWAGAGMWTNSAPRTLVFYTPDGLLVKTAQLLGIPGAERVFDVAYANGLMFASVRGAIYILAPPTAVEARTWGGIKALYR
jgi:hypothetical protein